MWVGLLGLVLALLPVTPAQAAVAPPSGLTSTSVSSNAVSLRWNAVKSAPKYRIQYSTSSSLSKATYVRVVDNAFDATSLKPSTRYYFRVRVITTSGGGLSDYSSTFSVETASKSGYSYLAPLNLSVTRTTSSAISLDWDSRGSGIRYRIEYSTSPSRANPVYSRFTPTQATITGLKPGSSYYFRVRVITNGGGSLSAYSPLMKASTAASSGYSHFAPKGLTVASSSPTSLSLRWETRGGGIRYRVQYSTSPTMSGAKYLRFTPNYATISGLRAQTKYYFRVRVITNDGGNLSGYSDAVRGETRSAGSSTTGGAPLRVVSYNVKCANCYSGLRDELPWNDRRGAVAATLLKQNPDVIGVQEASQGWLRDKSGKTIDLSQFEDLDQRLGSKYRLTNSKRNNCVKSTTPTGCVYANQGASKGSKILYNADRISLLAQGSRRLPVTRSTDGERYVAWAILQQKNTGKKFFFTNTHLEYLPDRSGQSTYYQLRRTQAQAVVGLIAEKNTGRLPVISVGDYNSTKWAAPTNGPYDVMVKAGLVDPLGNTYRSTSTAPGATVEKRINTSFYSYNGFLRSAPQRTNWINGSYIDYIFTSPMRVSEYENVVDVNSTGQFKGIIPADHNPQRATVHLP